MQGHNSVELVPEMLVGKDLLDKARSLSNRPEDEIARGCGYVGPSGRLLKKSFYKALVEAKAELQGWQLPRSTSRSSSTGGPRGRQADFRTRVHGNGNLLSAMPTPGSSDSNQARNSGLSCTAIPVRFGCTNWVTNRPNWIRTSRVPTTIRTRCRPKPDSIPTQPPATARHSGPVDRPPGSPHHPPHGP